MEWLDSLQDLLLNYWDKILLYFSMIPAGALVWKVGNIFVSLIKNWTAKKYTKKQQEYTERLASEINGLKGFLQDTIKEEVRNYVMVVKDTFNELQEKTQENKQKIYEKIFEKKMNVQEIVQEIKEDVKTEIEAISEEIPELEEVIEEKQEQVVEASNELKKKVDLL